MASRIKVDEVTNLNGSGNVSFPTGGASFQGNVCLLYTSPSPRD